MLALLTVSAGVKRKQSGCGALSSKPSNSAALTTASAESSDSVSPPQQALSAQLAVAITMRRSAANLHASAGRFAHMLEKSFVLHALKHRQTCRGHQCVAMMGAAQFANVETARLAPRQQRRQGHATAQPLPRTTISARTPAGLFGK